MKNMYPDKIAVHLVQFTTPSGVHLNGYWVGALKPKRVIVWTHGLGSNMFSKLPIARLLAKNLTAVLMYNNRGAYGVMSVGKGKTGRLRAGSAHENFEDCVDDIDGAIRFAKKSGAQEIYLAGHSTGSQKSVFWAARRKSRGVKGVILLAPMSDYAGALAQVGAKKLATVQSYARAQIEKKRGHELIPYAVWPYGPLDSHRFLSLYSGTSTEEIFSYAHPDATPAVLQAVTVPVLVVLAERDEYADRSAEEIEQWFLEHVFTGEVRTMSRANHGFKKQERAVVAAIDAFMKERYN